MTDARALLKIFNIIAANFISFGLKMRKNDDRKPKNINACRSITEESIESLQVKISMPAVASAASNLAAQTLLLFSLVFWFSKCQAELISFKLDLNPNFKTQANIQPGKFSEVCGKLKKGNLIRWQFVSSAPLDFNIHYHEGKDIIFPYKMNAIKSGDEELLISLDQDYCWMWTNKSKEAVKLEMSLRNAQAQ